MNIDDSFYVVDLGRVLELHRDWVTALPTVTPFYAVKCNNDPALLKTLAALGTGFDCASKVLYYKFLFCFTFSQTKQAEIKGMLDLGVTPSRIIYANPCKKLSHLKYAVEMGVETMTFDCDSELLKIQEECSSARLVLRIRADDPEAQWKLGIKFGCTVPEGKHLLSTAKNLGLNIIGVCFHVGSGSLSPRAYELALKMSAELFEYGYKIGYQFSLLDIGGGFPGDKGSKEVFQRVASAINSSLDSLFSSFPGLTVIAEPGFYFACSTHQIAVSVISKKSCDTKEGRKFMYYLNDGFYSAFRWISSYEVTPTPIVITESSGPLYPSILWGPTCDALDKFGRQYPPSRTKYRGLGLL
ncbi:ornithine decarboxylase-like isoform X2 [Halichondria panicea]|uniref:ornithine decarboxylase-like isoform X2 n=1 Tax=Halichondria panicea TaxID=6063 RepID=UPI00312B93BA